LFDYHQRISIGANHCKMADDNKKDKKKSKKHKKKRHRDDYDDDDDEDLRKAKKKKLKKEKKKLKKKKQREEKEIDEKIVSSSAIEFYPKDLKQLQLEKNQGNVNVNVNGDNGADAIAAAATAKTTPKTIAEEEAAPKDKANNITLLLFYQYVEPCWDDEQFQVALKFVTDQGNKYGLTGRMRVAKEGLNCTLTGSPNGIRNWCAALRKFDGGRSKVDKDTGEKITEFAKTEFKLTDDLPPKQRFPKLHAFEVVEIVNYGLAGSRAPEIAKYGGKFQFIRQRVNMCLDCRFCIIP
jgi:hypothetical protein